MKNFFLLFAISAFAFSSCKKKDKDCSLTEANLVGTYKITSVTYKDSASSAEGDYTHEFFDETCQEDDLYVIKSDHVITYSDAGSVCTPTGDDQANWSLSGTAFSIDGEVWPLENFSCDGFTLVETDYDVEGDKLSINFSKQ